MSTKFPAPSHPSSNSMTIVSDDPSYWPLINSRRIASYFVVAAFVGVMYDWALSFGQEVELVWRQRWSLMTVLYLSVRYLGMLFSFLGILMTYSRCSDDLVDRCSESSAPMPAIPIQLTATPYVSQILFFVWNWTENVAFSMLCVITIARLHAMYQRSRRIMIFLVVVSLAVNIYDGVVMAMATRLISGEELILSGTYQCAIDFAEDDIVLLGSITWILGAVWEVLALCLAVWIAFKHFRELRQHSAEEIIGDCFTVLIKSHVLYFASYVAVSCFILVVYFSPTISSDLFSAEIQVFLGLVQFLTVMQCFVLGPRLILSVREYNARLVADSDAATAMTSIAFQERVHISTGSGV
ncbi:hypothetical protein DEU56DRAFT_910649 [Suillus clintonianus]|uniref:uncharacterized protein n=1 Tax=Suillus clintonianus TaxID=1904413 RepID=UPI001B867269|nr:uncharacterized protein DEU56DRAFT_910649 [Suillus clintonianus]KAG2144299.1 hypothetical protein DEU56DRAFT_910649 [Suillus clintonianus]